MTWNIDKGGPRTEVLDELYNSPIPGHITAIKEQQSYSRCLDAVIAALRASESSVCSVSVFDGYKGELAIVDAGDTLAIGLPGPAAPTVTTTPVDPT